MSCKWFNTSVIVLSNINRERGPLHYPIEKSGHGENKQQKSEHSIRLATFDKLCLWITEKNIFFKIIATICKICGKSAKCAPCQEIPKTFNVTWEVPKYSKTIKNYIPYTILKSQWLTMQISPTAWDLYSQPIVKPNRYDRCWYDQEGFRAIGCKSTPSRGGWSPPASRVFQIKPSPRLVVGGIKFVFHI